MTAYVALLRAVNVGGTGKLPKEELKAMGEACGFENCRTFINSGNLLFTWRQAEVTAKRKLEAKVAEHFGKPFPVFVRSAKEMAEAVARNPFADDRPNRVMAHFIDEQPAAVMLDAARGVQGERMALGPRLIYVSYGEGLGQSKLKLPAVKAGTARNMNSVGRMAELLAEME